MCLSLLWQKYMTNVTGGERFILACISGNTVHHDGLAAGHVVFTIRKQRVDRMCCQAMHPMITSSNEAPPPKKSPTFQNSISIWRPPGVQAHTHAHTQRDIHRHTRTWEGHTYTNRHTHTRETYTHRQTDTYTWEIYIHERDTQTYTDRDRHTNKQTHTHLPGLGRPFLWIPLSSSCSTFLKEPQLYTVLCCSWDFEHTSRFA